MGRGGGRGQRYGGIVGGERVLWSVERRVREGERERRR
jgi:hypothetical protein